MREFKLGYYFRAVAREQYVNLNGIFQDDVDRRIDYLCQRPEPGDDLTFAWPEDGPNIFIYYDGVWVLTYALENDARVVENLSVALARRT